MTDVPAVINCEPSRNSILPSKTAPAKTFTIAPEVINFVAADVMLMSFVTSWPGPDIVPPRKRVCDGAKVELEGSVSKLLGERVSVSTCI